MLARKEISADTCGIYSAEEANEALRILGTGATQGKLLLQFAPNEANQ
jgi:hypothetical protein